MKGIESHKIVANELNVEVSRTEHAIAISNMIAHLEGVQLDQKQKLGAATIVGS
jgi:hypothetical protein